MENTQWFIMKLVILLMNNINSLIIITIIIKYY